jgi:hypothetical protein
MTTMKTTMTALMLLALPAATMAQPAPIHNPVVARMPCSMGAPTVRAEGYDAKPIRASLDDRGAAVYAPAARPIAQTGWARDVRREIAHGFRGACD